MRTTGTNEIAAMDRTPVSGAIYGVVAIGFVVVVVSCSIAATFDSETSVQD